MPTKEFKTIDEQVGILQERGLIVGDMDAARNFLLYNNYYRVSGYSLTLRSNDKFESNTRMENVAAIYNFDRALRALVLEFLLILEINVRSVYAYLFAQKYGPLEYKNPDNFDDENKLKKIIEHVEAEKEKVSDQELFVKHYKDINEEMPIWVFVELFSMGDISKLYSISKSELKLAVAAVFGITTKKTYVFEKILHGLTIVRNMCAHGSRLYDCVFFRKASVSERDKRRIQMISGSELDNSRLFGYIVNMKELLRPEDFLRFKGSLIMLSSGAPKINMSFYGFPNRWDEIL